MSFCFYYTSIICTYIIRLSFYCPTAYSSKKSAEIIENGGISELKEIAINGDKQFILVEGQDKEKPFVYSFMAGQALRFLMV